MHAPRVIVLPLLIFMHFFSTCFWFFHRICITLYAVPRYIDLHMHMYTGPSRGCRASSARLVVPGQTDKNDVIG